MMYQILAIILFCSLGFSAVHRVDVPVTDIRRGVEACVTHGGLTTMRVREIFANSTVTATCGTGVRIEFDSTDPTALKFTVQQPLEVW